MSKMNEKEVRHKAERIIKRYDSTINPPQEHVHDREVIHDLLALLDEKNEVIGRLPKTADGVPVCPGDFGLWGVNADCEIVEHCTAPGYLMCEGGEYEAWHIEERGGELYDVIIPAHEAFSDGAYYGAVSACYSTREAAEAARQGINNVRPE